MAPFPIKVACLNRFASDRLQKQIVEAVRLADIDFDKQVAMVWTTDNWATTNWSNTSGITPLLGCVRAGFSSSPQLAAGLAKPTSPSSAQP